jgi:hypothetical protein
MAVVGIAVQGMFLNTLLIIAVCATSMMGYALLFVIGVKPWWSAQYLIPILVRAQHHCSITQLGVAEGKLCHTFIW